MGRVNGWRVEVQGTGCWTSLDLCRTRQDARDCRDRRKKETPWRRFRVWDARDRTPSGMQSVLDKFPAIKARKLNRLFRRAWPGIKRLDQKMARELSGYKKGE